MSQDWHPDAIERALAHRDQNQVQLPATGRAHWAERVKMAQWWSDGLDRLRGGAETVRSGIPLETGGRARARDVAEGGT